MGYLHFAHEVWTDDVLGDRISEAVRHDDSLIEAAPMTEDASHVGTITILHRCRSNVVGLQ